MEVTEVRVKLVGDGAGGNEHLLAFCSITLDDMIAVRDVKVISGPRGEFVAMPSRKLCDHCPSCRTKNHLRALHCNQCGRRLAEDRAVPGADGKARLHADIAHPISRDGRDVIHTAVMAAYHAELEASREPGYVPRYDDLEDDTLVALGHRPRRA